MKLKEVTLFGGTGLIGSLLLDILIKDNDYHKINVVTRKSISLSHKKINNFGKYDIKTKYKSCKN